MGVLWHSASRLGWMLVLIVVAAPNAARATGCFSAEAPRITLDVRVDRVREVFDVSHDELEKAAIAVGRLDHLPVFGAYSALRGVMVDFDDDVRNAEGSAYCAVPKAVRVSIVVKDRVIHLARETQGVRCLLESTREHEKRHADADDLALVELAEPFLGRLRAEMVDPPIGVGLSPSEARDQLAEILSRKVDARFADVEARRRQINSAIDSPDNIERLHSACPDQKPDLL